MDSSKNTSDYKAHITAIIAALQTAGVAIGTLLSMSTSEILAAAALVGITSPAALVAFGVLSAGLVFFANVGLGLVLTKLIKRPKKPVDISEMATKEYDMPIEEIRKKAISELGLDCDNCYNVAITGPSGAGKSTTINYYCQHDHSNRAPVGVDETTQMVTKYVHPIINHLVFWDCPGAGTPAHPSETYFKDKMLCAFDYLVILFSDRFTEVDDMLIEKAIQFDLPVAVVRNKANHSLIAERRENPEFRNLSIDDAKTQLIDQLRGNIKISLSKYGDKIPPIFIINSWATDKKKHQYEENRLMEHLANVMNERRN